MSLVPWQPFGDVDTLFNRVVPSKKEYVIRAELPAVQKEDVQVIYDDGMIAIRGERKQQKDENNEKFHCVETVYGNFERRFSLPENANADTIRCESKDGILAVHIPKTETLKQKAKKISVQCARGSGQMNWR